MNPACVWRVRRVTPSRKATALVPHPFPAHNSPDVIHTSTSVEQTEAIAAQLSASFRGGECVALYGNLGAGKTQFVRGLVQGLGGPPRAVSSPTFVLLNVYPGGRLTVFHLDAYRVNGAEDFEAMGFTELLEQGGVVVVEWAQRVRDLLPSGSIYVSIQPTGKTTRRITIQHPDSCK